MSHKKSRIINHRRRQTLTKPGNLMQKDPTRQARCLLKHLVKRPTKYLSLRKRQSSSSSGQKALNPATPGHSHGGEGTIYVSQLFLEGLLSKRCLNPIPASLARQVKPSQTSRQPGCHIQVFSRARPPVDSGQRLPAVLSPPSSCFGLGFTVS